MPILAGICPLLQGRNGYLSSIGWKGRFLVVKCKKNGQKLKQNRNKRNGMETPLQTLLGFSSSYLQTTCWKPKYPQNKLGDKPANKPWIRKQIHKRTLVYLLFDGMGHHALAWRSTSLGWGSYGSMENWGEGVWVAWETKGLKASTQAA